MRDVLAKNRIIFQMQPPLTVYVLLICFSNCCPCLTLVPDIASRSAANLQPTSRSLGPGKSTEDWNSIFAGCNAHLELLRRPAPGTSAFSELKNFIIRAEFLNFLILKIGTHEQRHIVEILMFRDLGDTTHKFFVDTTENGPLGEIQSPASKIRAAAELAAAQRC